MSEENKVTEVTKNETNIKFSFTNEWNTWIKHLNWPFVIFHVILHIVAINGIFTFPYLTHKLTAFWLIFNYFLTGFGITGGAHRYWSHRSYKAKLPLRIFLATCYYSNGMFKLRRWIKLHRMHHKYSDTDADPHNINRGFWFAHIGWFLLPKHPEFTKKLKEIDMSDINADAVVTFGDKHFLTLTILLSFVIPTLVPVYLWNESWYLAIISQCFIRYFFLINNQGMINSVAHSYGYKPYDRSIRAVNNKFLKVWASGEGLHNFHHVFPWDYRAAEISKIDFNLTLHVINQFKKIGWAYDCKEASKELILKVAEARGDKNYINCE